MAKLDPTKFYYKENNVRFDIVYLDYDYIATNVISMFVNNSLYKNSFYATLVYEKNGHYCKGEFNLKFVCYADDRLNIYDMIIDDMHYNNGQAVVVKKPQQMINYEKLAEAYAPVQNSNAIIVTNTNVPEVVVPAVKKERKVLDFETPEFAIIAATYENPKKVYDWVINYDICNTEVSVLNNSISDKNMNLVRALDNHSEYIKTSVMIPLSNILEETFPENKPGFFGRLFNSSKEETYVLDSVSTEIFVAALHNTTTFDPKRFEGINILLDETRSGFETLKEELSYGISAANYYLDIDSENHQMRLHKERLTKMLISIGITEGQFMLIQKNFQRELNRLMELKDVTLPLLKSCVMSSVNKPISKETLTIIKNISTMCLE